MDESKITSEDIEQNKELAALSYLWLFSLVVLFARRDSHFIQFHARQGVVLFVLSLLLWPFEITRYGEFVILALIVLGFIEAAMGRAYSIPVISVIAGGKVEKAHFKKLWHVIKHTFIKIVKPGHITPSFMEELHEQEAELKAQEKFLDSERKMLEQEEKKLSALAHRVDEDENELHKLEDEVHHEFDDLKGDVHQLEDKVDKILTSVKD
ncbi:hypothetical protein KJ742_01325 [Patescibacteria group bacterium]|nr:hypothetical protein [Patescibacteria group bacterium]MBU1682565.1 hypothetical protein [Patescibacteria group bacterium]MBU1934584.1 hypothetical protein [Patescibacteria group bacterium]